MSIKLQDTIKKFREFYSESKRSPTYEEISKMFGFASTNASFKLVKKLIKLEILEKDATGKLIPKNLFKIPIAQQKQAGPIVDKDYLQNIVDELLEATHSLAEAHPAPNSADDFLRVIEATYRRHFYIVGHSLFIPQCQFCR